MNANIERTIYEATNEVLALQSLAAVRQEELFKAQADLCEAKRKLSFAEKLLLALTEQYSCKGKKK